MNVPSQVLNLLCCPESGQPLSLQDDQLVSQDGSASYPLVSGIPWLLAHPRNSLLDWGAKLNQFQQVLLKEISELEIARKDAEGAVHDRIECLLLAKKDFLLEITTLIEPITNTKVEAREQYGALLDRAPTTQNLLSYEANIYRDWQWGEEENTLCLQMIRDLAPSDLGKLCVLGAGACRLALDLHREAKPALTVATDINPLFLLAVNKLVSGESFLLTEFPMYPKLTEYVAIKHNMAALAQSPENFYLCFTDAARPAFKKHAFDTVLTPWLIDIQPHEFSKFLKQLNQYIPIGGYWLNFGSLVFNQKRESLCYSSDEVIELAAEAGFEIEEMTQSEIPYLKSPYSAGYRIENVWTWKAIKRSDVESDSELQVLPNWLIDHNKPIPTSSDFTALRDQNQFLANLFKKIDGQKSIRDIAYMFEQEQGLDAEELEQMLVAYFSELHGV